MMNNEEILKAAQAEPQELGEYEATIMRKALAYGAACGVGVCLILILLEMFIEKRFDYGKPAMIFALSGFSKFYEGRGTKNKKKLVAGIVELIVAAVGLLLFIGALFV